MNPVFHLSRALVVIIVLVVLKKGMSNICQDCQFWCKKGVKVDHAALYSYNQAMKEYFSRYKFDGDYILRKVFSKILQKELKKYKDYQNCDCSSE